MAIELIEHKSFQITNKISVVETLDKHRWRPKMIKARVFVIRLNNQMEHWIV